MASIDGGVDTPSGNLPLYYSLCHIIVLLSWQINSLSLCRLVVFVRLSVPVQVIDWKDSSPKYNVLMGTLNPTHSLTHIA